MANGRTGLSSWILPPGFYDLLFGPTTPAHTVGAHPVPTPAVVTTPPPETKTSHVGDMIPTPDPTPGPTPLSMSAIENLKTDLWKFAATFREEEKFFSQARAKLVLLRDTFQRTNNHLLQNVTLGPNEPLLIDPLKDLVREIKEIEKVDGKLLDDLLKDAEAIKKGNKDIPFVIAVCDKAIKLFNHLYDNIVNIEQDIQLGRDNRSALGKLLQFFLAWKNIPDLTRPGQSERDDNELYKKISSLMNEFREWLENAVVDIQQAKKPILNYVAAREVEFAVTKEKKTDDPVTPLVVPAEIPTAPAKQSAAVITQRLAVSERMAVLDLSEVKPTAVNEKPKVPVSSESMGGAVLEEKTFVATEASVLTALTASVETPAPPSSPASPRRALHIVNPVNYPDEVEIEWGVSPASPASPHLFARKASHVNPSAASSPTGGVELQADAQHMSPRPGSVSP